MELVANFLVSEEEATRLLLRHNSAKAALLNAHGAKCTCIWQKLNHSCCRLALQQKYGIADTTQTTERPAYEVQIGAGCAEHRCLIRHYSTTIQTLVRARHYTARQHGQYLKSQTSSFSQSEKNAFLPNHMWHTFAPVAKPCIPSRGSFIKFIRSCSRFGRRRGRFVLR
jgi:hypothetical protein